VVHAGTDIDLEVVADREELTVTVTDFAEGLPTRITPNGVEIAEGGRGMLLVDHFATSWGTTHYPHGKGVWFRLTRGRPPSAEPSGAVPPFGAPSAAALAALAHSDLRLADTGSLGPDCARLLGRLCGATAATGAVIHLDQADEGGLAPIAEYGVVSPDPARLVTVPLQVSWPWRGELVLSAGNFYQTNDQFSFGSHSDRFAYYTSLNANRTDLGLETPTSKVLHDRANGFGAFTSLIFNSTPSDQLRFVGSARQDHYQVPNDTDLQAALISDREREQDAFGNFSWIHTWSPNLVLTATPFYHFNRAAFEGGPNDVPSTIVNRASNYAGGQLSVSAVYGKNNASAGIYGFGQHDNTQFGLIANDGSGDDIAARDSVSGQLEALFLQDQFKLTSWLTLNGGVRLTHFAGAISENAADPRLGMAIRLPHLNWVLRVSYSRYYQAPPLSTISGPLLEFATAENLGFLPLKGERDEQHEFGLTIPIRSWTADVAYFRTGARNFFDHDVIGDSNIFFPLTIDHVRIRGLETTVRSPRVFKRVDFHLAYSHQSAEGTGGVTGGLTDFSPPPDSFFYLDHDQRDTLSTGLTTTMKWRSWLSANFTYGSGFLNGNGPDHLSSYRTIDLSLGKSFGESWSAKVSAMNLTNKRYFIDLSNTFGGSHFANPREISLQVRYRFHY